MEYTKEVKYEVWEMKTTVSEVKIKHDGINSPLDIAERQVSEPEDIMLETI